MPEIHLRPPGYTINAFGTFTKNKQRIQKFKETGHLRYIYQSELDKVCFQFGMPYGDFKDLIRRTASGKVLRDKAFNIGKNHKFDGCQRGLVSTVYNFLIKKTAGGAAALANKSAVLLIFSANNHGLFF